MSLFLPYSFAAVIELNLAGSLTAAAYSRSLILPIVPTTFLASSLFLLIRSALAIFYKISFSLPLIFRLYWSIDRFGFEVFCFSNSPRVMI